MDVEAPLRSLPSISTVATDSSQTDVHTQTSDGTLSPIPTLAKEPPDWLGGTTNQLPDLTAKTTHPKSQSGSPDESGQLNPELRFLKEAHEHLGRYKESLLPVLLCRYRLLLLLLPMAFQWYLKRLKCVFA